MKKMGRIVIVAVSLLCHQMDGTYPLLTLDSPGFYKLAANVSNQITITANNVTLDMNGHVVSGGTNGIVINGNVSNVTIKNGSIRSVTSDGVQVNSGCQDISLIGLSINNALRGISLEEVTNGLIKNCDMNLNTTGMEIGTCQNIVLQDCTAQSNVQAGYCLLSSTTCSLFDCKALSTGKNNNNSSGDESFVYGFVSRDGYGHIFERCIANSTQNLNATEWNTRIAGFALLGTGTQCHKIIECESANTMASPEGLSEPTGIYLQPTMRELTPVAIFNLDNISTNALGVGPAWSPDGRYFTVSATNGGFGLYKFDRSNDSVQFLDSVTSGAFGCRDTDWHPDGEIVLGALNTMQGVYVMRFNAINETLELLQQIQPGGNVNANSIRWHPSGKFFAVGYSATFGTEVFSFDRVTQRATVVVSETTPDRSTAAWHPSGKYLFVGRFQAISPEIYIYEFNENPPSLSFLLSQNVPGSPEVIQRGDFSPDGNYLAIIKDENASGEDSIVVYTFDGTSLTQLATADGATTTGARIEWSPDGRFLAAGGIGDSQDPLRVYSFNPSEGSSALQLVSEYDSIFNNNLRGVRWSPDGAYIIIGGSETNNIAVQILTALTYPSGNVIQNNKVYCNSNGSAGIGITGSGIQNTILNNTAFSNPLNYLSLTNVFDQRYGEGPSLLQSIGLDTKESVCYPDNIPTRMKRTERLLESLIDNLL